MFPARVTSAPLRIMKKAVVLGLLRALELLSGPNRRIKFDAVAADTKLHITTLLAFTYIQSMTQAI